MDVQRQLMEFLTPIYACVIFTILGEIQESMKKIREIGILVSDVSEALKNKETI